MSPYIIVGIERMERDHDLDAALAVWAWLDEASHAREARKWYVDRVIPLLRRVLAA